MDVLVERILYPEVEAGGFSRADHRMAFLLRLHAVLRPDMTVLEYGAGHGKWRDDPSDLRRRLGDLRGQCRKVIGADVDPAVLGNKLVDERIVLSQDAALPFADATFDLISAFAVFEHIADPRACAAELARVLKPGGWIIGWTPNRHGYVGVGARLVPRSMQERVLRVAEPLREEGDSFVPLYRLNDAASLRREFPGKLFEHFSYTYNGMPLYHAERSLIARFWQMSFWFLPPPLRAYYMVILRKRTLERPPHAASGQ